jgi:molecular chaperone DnaK (HSP70)
VDTRSAEQRVQVLEVPQLIAPAELAGRSQLPSFVYLAGEHDLGPAETALPWAADRRWVVGELARNQGARVPGRMIASAKSWLCHPGVDRNAAILPWGVGDDVAKISPVEASARVLGHIQEAWDHARAGEPGTRFADQEIVITVPASFDEAARELTLAAAARAGYPPVVLLEEPQAAFYAWIESHPADRRGLRAGERVLVFDIGGGTTDFTLIAVGADGDSFERTAVGDHLLLGGDNIDLTLAKIVEARVAGGRKLDPVQWNGLVHACRLAKETILSDEAVASVPITIAGRGSKLIGGTLKTEIARAELEETILGGFFPVVEQGAQPQRQRSGLQEFGLPYAADPAVPRHLAAFLARHPVEIQVASEASETEPARGRRAIDAVLFNGGAMTPAALRRRILEQIGGWQTGAPRELANQRPELAVAQGAAYYGLVRRGLGARIRGGTARSFYVGVGRAAGGDEMAVCLAPPGLEEGSALQLERDFALVTNRPVSFKLFSSSSRDDQPGALVPVGDGLAASADDDSDLLELPPIVTVLRAPGRAQVDVRLEVKITELGALEVWCRERGGDGHWRLSFDMRAGGATRAADGTEAAPDPKVPEVRALMERAFKAPPGPELASIMKGVEAALGARRDEWSMSTTRALFDALLDLEPERKRSPDHEQRWLTLAGFCLRPGTGAPLDQWRAKQMWRVFNDGLAFERKSEACRLAWWIVWRRVAGGLTQGQQEQLWDRLSQLFLPSAKQKKKWHETKATPQEAAEMWRTLANLERLPPPMKMKLGDELIRRIETDKTADPLHFWALGRIGARVPLYGPLNCVVAPQKAGEWVAAVLDRPLGPELEKAAFPLAQLGRRTGDRARDLDPDLRDRLSARLRELPGGDRTALLVDQIVALEAREERVALGDTLPAGLRLISDDESAPAD